MTKREYIIELIRLTNLQTQALEREDIEEFIELMNKREEILELINIVHKDEPTTREQQEYGLVQELKEIDNKNRVEFEKQFQQVKENLCKVRQMKKREDHYNNPYDISFEEGMFFDKKERR